MANRSDQDEDTPPNVQGLFKARKAEWDLSSANHQGQRLTPRKQAEHKTASDPIANISRPLAMREPSTQDVGDCRLWAPQPRPLRTVPKLMVINPGCTMW